MQISIGNRSASGDLRSQSTKQIGQVSKQGSRNIYQGETTNESDGDSLSPTIKQGRNEQNMVSQIYGKKNDQADRSIIKNIYSNQGLHPQTIELQVANQQQYNNNSAQQSQQQRFKQLQQQKSQLNQPQQHQEGISSNTGSRGVNQSVMQKYTQQLGYVNILKQDSIGILKHAFQSQKIPSEKLQQKMKDKKERSSDNYPNKTVSDSNLFTETGKNIEFGQIVQNGKRGEEMQNFLKKSAQSKSKQLDNMVSQSMDSNLKTYLKARKNMTPDPTRPNMDKLDKNEQKISQTQIRYRSQTPNGTGKNNMIGTDSSLNRMQNTLLVNNVHTFTNGFTSSATLGGGYHAFSSEKIAMVKQPSNSVSINPPIKGINELSQKVLQDYMKTTSNQKQVIQRTKEEPWVKGEINQSNQNSSVSKIIQIISNQNIEQQQFNSNGYTSQSYAQIQNNNPMNLQNKEFSSVLQNNLNALQSQSNSIQNSVPQSHSNSIQNNVPQSQSNSIQNNVPQSHSNSIQNNVPQSIQNNAPQTIQNNAPQSIQNNVPDQTSNTKAQENQKESKNRLIKVQKVVEYNENKPIQNEIDDTQKVNKLLKENNFIKEETQKQQDNMMKNAQQTQLIRRESENKLISNTEKKDFNVIRKFNYKTKAGCNYNGPKTNQDNFIILPNINGRNDRYIFSVCDGHGSNGHFCSALLRRVLPKEALAREVDNLENEFVENSLNLAFLQTSKELLESNIDCTFSGSTCVLLLIIGKKMWSANTGDSRAIMCGQINSGWSVKELTRDHKPNDPDEYERIISRGGRVETYLDEQNNPIGPYRVWLKDENLPGLAMARSFGDVIASQVGVICEPDLELYLFGKEVKSFKIGEQDKFIVVASDGVWEFISNEQSIILNHIKVMNKVVPYYIQDDTELACSKLVKASITSWRIVQI